MANADVSRMLLEMAEITSLLDGNPFKIRAFRQAAQVIDSLPVPVAEPWREGTLTELPSIGARIAEKIGEYISRGTCSEYEELKAQIPAGILELLQLEGVGPQTVKLLWHGLGISTVDDLQEALRQGRLQGVRGIGKVRMRALQEAIDRRKRVGGRMLLHHALAYAEGILSTLRKTPGVLRAEAAGSLRRRRETVGDIDLLVSSRDPEAVMEAFIRLPAVEKIIAKGTTRSSIRLGSGIQVDLRVLPPETFGAALHYFTGSKRHNVAIRTRAVRRGLKVSEYGVFDREGKRLSGEDEGDVFRAVGLPWIPPELREGSGEIEAASEGRLPHLVEPGDLLGDLHVHSDASSDGMDDLRTLWEEGKRLGRSYLAITDHSRSRPLGLGPEALLEHADAIRSLSARLPGGPKLLAGIEVDILRDGGLDLPAEVLAGLDWVVASIHAGFHEPEEINTGRILRAIRSGVVDAIGHPSGRKIGSREPYPLDVEAIFREAGRHGVALEVNAQQDRLDLDDRSCKLAKEMGVAVAIGSDAHIAVHLANLRNGLWVARRGWLERADVLNTRTAAELASWKARRSRRKKRE